MSDFHINPACGLAHKFKCRKDTAWVYRANGLLPGEVEDRRQRIFNIYPRGWCTANSLIGGFGFHQLLNKVPAFLQVYASGNVVFNHIRVFLFAFVTCNCMGGCTDATFFWVVWVRGGLHLTGSADVSRTGTLREVMKLESTIVVCALRVS